MGASGLLGFCIVAFTPAPNLLSRWMTLPAPSEPVAAIVVLGGGGVRGDGTLTDVSLRRTIKALDLYRQGLAPLLVFSGGVTAQGHDEAKLRATLAQSCGVDPAAIVTESGGRTTREEAAHLAARLLPKRVRKIALVVDAEGTRRATAAFRRAGFTVVPVASSDVDNRVSQPKARLALMRRVAVEVVAWIYYRVAGYI